MNDELPPEQGPALVPFKNYAEKAAAAGEMEKLATTDGLTGALNREGLQRYLENARLPKAMLLVDATNFKAVNDKYGYEKGDQLVIDTHNLLASSVRADDKIARWGGDEFVVILNDEASVEDSANEAGERSPRVHSPLEYINETKNRIADRVKEVLADRPDLASVNFDLAVGGTQYDGTKELKELISQAELDMKSHKNEQHQKKRYRAA